MAVFNHANYFQIVLLSMNHNTSHKILEQYITEDDKICTLQVQRNLQTGVGGLGHLNNVSGTSILDAKQACICFTAKYQIL